MKCNQLLVSLILTWFACFQTIWHFLKHVLNLISPLIWASSFCLNSPASRMHERLHSSQNSALSNSWDPRYLDCMTLEQRPTHWHWQLSAVWYPSLHKWVNYGPIKYIKILILSRLLHHHSWMLDNFASMATKQTVSSILGLVQCRCLDAIIMSLVTIRKLGRNQIWCFLSPQSLCMSSNLFQVGSNTVQTIRFQNMLVL